MKQKNKIARLAAKRKDFENMMKSISAEQRKAFTKPGSIKKS